MTMRAAILALPLALCAAAPASAGDFEQWVQFSAAIDLSERIVLQDEIVARFSNDDGGLYEIENALMLGYKLPGKVTLWAGYVHDPNYSAGEFTVMERRALVTKGQGDLQVGTYPPPGAIQSIAPALLEA